MTASTGILILVALMTLLFVALVKSEDVSLVAVRISNPNVTGRSSEQYKVGRATAHRNAASGTCV